MKITHLNIPDVLLIEPRVFEDARGFFFESFREDLFRKETSLNISFVQDNHSKSNKGVLRGLHYQLPPKAQGKLVRVIQGEVLELRSLQQFQHLQTNNPLHHCSRNLI